MVQMVSMLCTCVKSVLMNYTPRSDKVGETHVACLSEETEEPAGIGLIEFAFEFV